ncbi:DNA recombination protein RmuC [Niabella insulamsoli]|uniref:DNA recombination protein RmuC n=1 Tax=Niabella insulamsoli TaxID=3144874 RepID=UPI003D12864F
MALYLSIGLIVGWLIGWLLTQTRAASKMQSVKDEAASKLTALEKDAAALKATAALQLENAARSESAHQEELTELKQRMAALQTELDQARQQFAAVKAGYDTARQNLIEKNNEALRARSQQEQLLADQTRLQQELATARANNQSLLEKLQTQKTEIEALGKKFNTEFENIANKILETKTSTFTELNKTNMKSLLEPLGENIKEFKKQVNEAYGKESNERFSLQNEVKNLVLLNQALSKEAQNLTRALKSESKTQGRWGEMVLEKILEKSGLRKNEEFFMEHQLFGIDGRPLLSAVSGKKMRPDALIVYPDNRHVIVDAKVSLTAFVRYAEAEEETLQEAALIAHVRSVKAHIDELQVKAYDDYDKSMDFVMMFIPNEAAYFAALKGDAHIWEYAYDRRILLISPTNLIAALKLLADLWKRERNERNSMDIANRALKMYEKLVGFSENLDAVGRYMDNAKNKYDDAVNQLHKGKDNFFAQAGKMKQLLNYNKPKDFTQAKLDLGADHDFDAADPENGGETLTTI